MNWKVKALAGLTVTLAGSATSFGQVYSAKINTAEFNSVQSQYETFSRNQSQRIAISKLSFVRSGIEFSVEAKSESQSPVEFETRGNIYEESYRLPYYGALTGTLQTRVRRKLNATLKEFESRQWQDVYSISSLNGTLYKTHYTFENRYQSQTHPAKVQEEALTTLDSTQIGWMGQQMDAVLQTLGNEKVLAFLRQLKIDHVQVVLTDDHNGLVESSKLRFGPEIKDDPYLRLFIVARPGGKLSMTDEKTLEDQLLTWSSKFDLMKAKLESDPRSPAQKAAEALRQKAEKALDRLGVPGSKAAGQPSSQP